MIKEELEKIITKLEEIKTPVNFRGRFILDEHNIIDINYSNIVYTDEQIKEAID